MISCRKHGKPISINNILYPYYYVSIKVINTSKTLPCFAQTIVRGGLPWSIVVGWPNDPPEVKQARTILMKPFVATHIHIGRIRGIILPSTSARAYFSTRALAGRSHRVSAGRRTLSKSKTSLGSVTWPVTALAAAV
jgi:hypothetical protein